jgi:Fungal protein kinase
MLIDLPVHGLTWLGMREVLAAQGTRRFAQAFTLCGSTMRLWEFDRLGRIASSSFDSNKQGLQFVLVVLGYLCMDNKQLGFDPTIKELHGKCYLHITRNGKTERLVIVGLLNRTSSIASRATTC